MNIFRASCFVLNTTAILTLSSPGFSGSSQPGGGGQGRGAQTHHNFFVIGRIMMKLGQLVKCFKLYLMMGFWWLIGCDVIMTS